MLSVFARIGSDPPAAVRPAYHLAKHLLWTVRGRHGMTPHRVKQRAVREHARRYRLRTLVETGTYRGDMVWAMRRDFDEIHTVELDHELWRRAVERFSAHPGVHLHEGDSGRVLAAILEAIDEPALFWLDGHYSGGITAGGDQPTPVRAELAHVLAHPVRGHVVLIDDASLFIGEAGYPSLDELRATLSGRPDLSLDVREDIIRIAPAPPGASPS